MMSNTQHIKITCENQQAELLIEIDESNHSGCFGYCLSARSGATDDYIEKEKSTPQFQTAVECFRKAVESLCKEGAIKTVLNEVGASLVTEGEQRLTLDELGQTSAIISSK